VRQLLLYREAVGDWNGKTAEIATSQQAASKERLLKRLPAPRNDNKGEGNETAEVDVMAVIEGRVVDVRCSICGRVRTWVPLDM
jgi:hypothetical protein